MVEHRAIGFTTLCIGALCGTLTGCTGRGLAVDDAASGGVAPVSGREMMQILEDYTYGHMPPPPGNVTAVPVSGPTEITTTSGVDAVYRKLHLSFGPGGELGFDVGLFFPKANAAPDGEAEARPVLISLSFGSGEDSLGRAAGALARGYAVATIGYQELGADSPDYASSAFFPA
ncbi:hypothetical protein BE21_56425 [Sorangium cellulosum]|uniref:Uncharacterized protein n=1 Tax=Sorangium cellulosum TaxID=56 RepID=A0A150TAW6_SORCE|nr:hypothetical protein BE21_56425 [Sorangium cellulosum]